MNYIDKTIEIDKLKKELDKFRPLNSDVVQQLKNYYKISLTYSTNALEGNTLTESETKVVIEDGITIGGHPIKEIQEVTGHIKAYDFLYNLINKDLIEENDILTLHKLFYEQIDSSKAGKYRKKEVIITGTTYIPPKSSEIKILMDKFIKNINSKKNILHPIQLASFIHLNFVNIHPFIDGNGRCARLLTNLYFLKNAYAPIIIPPVLRGDYLECLKLAQIDKNEEQFYNFISEMELESLKDYIRIIKHLSV